MTDSFRAGKAENDSGRTVVVPQSSNQAQAPSFLPLQQDTEQEFNPEGACSVSVGPAVTEPVLLGRALLKNKTCL